MPFGDNTKVYALALPPGELPARGEKLPARLVKDVPTAPAPWWWSEYLMDEWKRKHGLTARRDGRTEWQKDKEQWEHADLMARGPQFLQGTRGIPRHCIWED